MLDEFVSVEGARTEYGVVVDTVDPEILDYRVNVAETGKLQEKMRKA